MSLKCPLKKHAKLIYFSINLIHALVISGRCVMLKMLMTNVAVELLQVLLCLGKAMIAYDILLTSLYSPFCAKE